MRTLYDTNEDLGIITAHHYNLKKKNTDQKKHNKSPSAWSRALHVAQIATFIFYFVAVLPLYHGFVQSDAGMKGWTFCFETACASPHEP